MAEEQKITGFKCKNCGRINYPERVRCLSCKGREFEEVELGDKCELITYTQIYNPPVGIDVDPPLIIGLVEFPNEVKVMGQLDVVDPEYLKIGKELRPVWGKLRKVGEKDVYGFRFRLSEESAGE